MDWQMGFIGAAVFGGLFLCLGLILKALNFLRKRYGERADYFAFLFIIMFIGFLVVGLSE